MGEFAIFRLDSTTTDEDPGRPEVDLTDTRNQGPAWQRLREIWLGQKPVESYLPIEVYIDSSDVESFHGYYGGESDFFSWEVARVLEKSCPDQTRFLPVSVNGYRFFSFYVEATTDCLDKHKAQVKYFASGRAMDVDLYSFDFAKLRDPMILSIPEKRRLIFVTETLAEALDNLQLRGIEIYEASGLPRWHTKWQRRTVKDVKAARLSTAR